MEKITKEELIAFEKDISELFLNKQIRVPIHLSGNNENQLIEIFKNINENDWVLSTHRNHYHVLLKGMPKEELKKLILSGESMHIYSEKYRIITSAIVGGVIPIGIGIAMGIKKRRKNNIVWVFIGDMAAETGIFHECHKYATRNKLPIKFIIEDNGYSTDILTQ
jgi:pyruvate dehydrogenase E1 component alpha subunit